MNGPVERGPNYDWKHEGEHYREECEKTQKLLDVIDASAERLTAERDRYKAALENVIKQFNRECYADGCTCIRDIAHRALKPQSSRCKHDVHGEDCYECYPQGEKGDEG